MKAKRKDQRRTERIHGQLVDLATGKVLATKAKKGKPKD